MRKVISGKVYDTDTAEEIHEYCSSHGAGDFASYCESLYKTKKGAYFLAGKGGPMTRWRESVESGGWSGGSGIQPVSEDEARDWCETHGVRTSKIEELFQIEVA